MSEARQLFTVGLGYFENQDWEPAIDYFQLALNLDPQDPETRCRFDQALVVSGRLDEGILELKIGYEANIPGARAALLDAIVAQVRQADRPRVSKPWNAASGH